MDPRSRDVRINPPDTIGPGRARDIVRASLLAPMTGIVDIGEEIDRYAGEHEDREASEELV